MHDGAKCIGKRAARSACIIAKSSDAAPCQNFSTSAVLKVVRRIAVDPPQQKLPLRLAPSADAIEAFHTERRWAVRPPRTGTNHLYPVAAPTATSESGSTRA